MTDVLKTPEKKIIRRALVAAAYATLEREGWKVGRARGRGVKGRVREITKDGKTQLAAIRTSQDHWIAFPRNQSPRNQQDTKWVTLADVDVVVAAAVDDPTQPKFAQVHIFDAKDLRERFDRSYAARRKAGHTIPVGRGMWVSLYYPDSDDPVNRVGGGIGLDHPPIARMPLDESASTSVGGRPPAMPPTSYAAAGDDDDFEPLTIPEAKARLARTLGVEPAAIRITVEG
jgi:hypothetical protein